MTEKERLFRLGQDLDWFHDRFGSEWKGYTIQLKSTRNLVALQLVREGRDKFVPGKGWTDGG